MENEWGTNFTHTQTHTNEHIYTHTHAYAWAHTFVYSKLLYLQPIKATHS